MGINDFETLCAMIVLLPHIQNTINGHLYYLYYEAIGILACVDQEKQNNTNKQANKQ